MTTATMLTTMMLMTPRLLCSRNPLHRPVPPILCTTAATRQGNHRQQTSPTAVLKPAARHVVRGMSVLSGIGEKNMRTAKTPNMRRKYCTELPETNYPVSFHWGPNKRMVAFSGVLLKMEVGIRKGAWQRAWRYPAYLWSLRWVYAVKKTRRLVYGVYPRIPPNIPLVALCWQPDGWGNET